MSARSPARIVKPAAAIALIAVIVMLGVLVRLEDPLSTSVIPAEDPYTHMALVRSHLADGTLDPLNNDGRLYPPGMHAVVAAVWVYTGIPLDDIFRFGPVALGGIGIIGIALLLWRCHGPVAAIVGALAAALAPEMIFRTNMMSPTALDLAVLPFFILAVLETLRGRLAWGTAVAGLSLFFVLAHPWVLAILVPTTLAVVVLWFLLGGKNQSSGSLHAVGAAVVLACGAGALLLAVSTCWSQCAIGGQAAGATPDLVDELAMAAAAGALIVAACLAVLGRRIARWHERKRRVPVLVRLLMSVGIAAALVAISIPAFQAGMPEHVLLPRMIGMPILYLAAAGLVALPFLPSRAAFAGAAMVAVTYPFVIYNPLDSEFWPHRTAVYLAVGLAISTGIGASAIVAGVRRTFEWLSQRLGARGRAKAPQRSLARRVSLSGIAALLATTMVAGSVYAQTPLAYETGWYRLYPECEYDGLKAIAHGADDDTIIVTGDWRPKLVMAANARNADNIWFDRTILNDVDRRETLLMNFDKEGKDVIVVFDRHMRLEHPETDTSFVEDGEWTQMGPWCSGGMPGERLHAYHRTWQQ